MTQVEKIKKKLEKREKDILDATRMFLNSQGIEFSEIHRVILLNAMREMVGYVRDMIEPEVKKLIKTAKKCTK